MTLLLEQPVARVTSLSFTIYLRMILYTQCLIDIKLLNKSPAEKRGELCTSVRYQRFVQPMVLEDVIYKE